jgi:ubiquinone/menaquinone biosynthesis C-methylase UbiE
MPEPMFDAVAAVYDRAVGRWSRLYIPCLLAAAGIQSGDCVLDVATGTGEAARAAAAIVGPIGRVIGSDLSLPMLRAGRSKAGNTAIAVMDALVLACRNDSVDAVICQLGLMFFPDLARGLREFRRVLREDRWMAACVWSAPERAPFVSILPAVVSRYVPAQRDKMLLGTLLGDRDRLQDLVAGAGFRDVSVTAETQPIAFTSFEEYWEPIAAGGSPTAAVYKGLPESTRHAVRAEVRAQMQPYFSGERLVLDTEGLIVAGKK